MFNKNMFKSFKWWLLIKMSIWLIITEYRLNIFIQTFRRAWTWHATSTTHFMDFNSFLNRNIHLKHVMPLLRLYGWNVLKPELMVIEQKTHTALCFLGVATVAPRCRWSCHGVQKENNNTNRRTKHMVFSVYASQSHILLTTSLHEHT